MYKDVVIIGAGPGGLKSARILKQNNIDLDRVLVKSYDEFLSIYTSNPKVKENNELSFR